MTNRDLLFAEDLQRHQRLQKSDMKQHRKPLMLYDGLLQSRDTG